MKKDKNWVDYKEIKSAVTMKMALEYYGVLDNFKESGGNLVGPCPIHKGSSDRQFSVNTGKNIFNCFGSCEAGGNVLDFVAKMEKVPVREAALLLKDWLLDSDNSKVKKSSFNKSEQENKGVGDLSEMIIEEIDDIERTMQEGLRKLKKDIIKLIMKISL